jgi:hypothetical protein
MACRVLEDMSLRIISEDVCQENILKNVLKVVYLLLNPEL